MFVAVWVLIQVLEGVLISTARKNGMRAIKGAMRRPDIIFMMQRCGCQTFYTESGHCLHTKDTEFEMMPACPSLCYAT